MSTNELKREGAMKRARNNPDILDEYDFSGGVRGKYAMRCSAGTRARDSLERFEGGQAIDRGLESSSAGKRESVREIRTEEDLPK
jgi:hypothetical protein